MAALARRCFANRCDDRALLADVVDGALTPGAADASYGDGDNTVNLAAGEFHSRYFVHKLRYIQHPINYLFGGFSGFVRRENVVFPTYFKDRPQDWESFGRNTSDFGPGNQIWDDQIINVRYHSIYNVIDIYGIINIYIYISLI